MSELFDNYEEEFNELRVNIEQKIRNIPTLDGTQRRGEVQKAESDIRDLGQNIRTMNLSARNNPALLAKIKEYENEVSRLKTSLRKADMQVSVSGDREELFSGIKTEDVMAASYSQRDRLLQTNEKLDKSTIELVTAVSDAEGLVGTGGIILDNLDRQTDQMRGMRDKLEGINESLDKAKRLMKGIARRAYANKLILFVIILVLLFAVGLVVWFKWFRKTDSTPVTNPPGTSTGGTTGMYTTTTI